MSEQQALVERMVDEIINAGHLDVTDELFASDFVDHGPMGETHGREAFNELVAMWRAAVADVHCTVEHWFESGDMAGGTWGSRAPTPAR
jgi:hypothetical protein